ncbi:MAG: glycosyltransferase family 4 protein [Miltoncostaeaceae bacterium]
MRVAVVSPRYGAEIGGGAETLARLYAHRLAARAEVTVLTTCALEYRTWADHYPPGESRDGAVRVRRFPVPRPRDGARFDALSARLLGGAVSGEAAEREWMAAQGPVAPGLTEHLREYGDGYDAVLFVPYLYATTVHGLPAVSQRAVLIPALHDEPPLALGIFDEVVRAARRLVFSTPEEQDLAVRRFGIDRGRSAVVGVGVDPPPPADPARGRAALGLGRRPYALCLGRIEPSKGSDVLIEAHERYRRHRPEGLDLVMVGRQVMDLPSASWLHAPGFVEEQTKHDLLAGAALLVCPSPYESLSLVLLEAWSHGVPTLSSKASPVLVGQSSRSRAGLWFEDALGYAAALDLLGANPPLARALGHAGRRFTQGLTWGAVTARLWEQVEAAAAEGAAP